MRAKYLLWAALPGFIGCEDAGSLELSEDTDDEQDEECECEDPDCQCDEIEDCTRIMSYTIIKDGNKGELEGTWNAGKHGDGWLGATWQDEDGWAWLTGQWGWGTDDYTDEGELEGWLWEEDSALQVEGWAWTSNTQAYFRGSHAIDDEQGKGWWSFGEAWMEATGSQDESEGTFTGTWTPPEGTGLVSGSWGPYNDYIGGWVTGSFSDKLGKTMALEGSWEPGDEGAHSWHGELENWGYWAGTSEPIQGGRWIYGIGYPFGCPAH